MSLSKAIVEFSSVNVYFINFFEGVNKKHGSYLCFTVSSGQLRINKLIRLGVGAHISTLASPKVLSTVSGLPPVVDVKLLSRSEVWPPSFERLPPTNVNIGLFIFPQNERCVFSSLIPTHQCCFLIHVFKIN